MLFLRGNQATCVFPICEEKQNSMNFLYLKIHKVDLNKKSTFIVFANFLLNLAFIWAKSFLWKGECFSYNQICAHLREKFENYNSRGKNYLGLKNGLVHIKVI